ncbi:head GIN domain-containing protein [Polluticaenibacter yanchengensis]|uniref:DUF2807 domain-containing protein n=1 Tax=Polluticaenibacter yanchengensis TaxID=3014562 RepID=A0ABT4UEL0_9BACT|nr:DUF2807 domain-containing protein [Chitinophagaceae bacterium LY-5]
MKKIVAIVAAVFITLCSFNFVFNEQVINDPNITVRNISSNFNIINVSGAVDVYLTQDKNVAMAVSASKPEYINNIVTEVSNGTLFISSKGFVKGNSPNYKIYLSVDKLDKITSSGASDIYLKGTFKQPDLEIALSGASDIAGEVKIDNLKLSGSGSSDFKLSGYAENLKLVVSGASDIKGYTLSCKNANITASGASDVKLTVHGEVSAVASGASDIKIKGTANITNSSSTGASSIKKVS